MDKITDYKTIGEKYGNKDLYKKKLAPNKKYDSVKAVVNTGSTIKNVQVLSDQYIAKRKGENFKRIKASTVVKLLGENKNTESIYQLAEESGQDIDGSKITSVVGGGVNMNDNQSVYSQKTDMTIKTGRTGKSLKSTKTTITNITYATEMLGNLEDLSFILLDFRDRSDYDNFHIREAVSYPAPNILRDKFTAEMYTFKNKDGKLIIVYDNEERTGIAHAQLLFQKGFDNVFLISGGLEDFVKVYPEMCEGPGVQALILAKEQLDLMKKDAPIKGPNRTGFSSKNITVASRAKSSDKITVVSSKMSVVSNASRVSKANQLKNNLQK